jgi:cyanophycin synthetase
VPRSLLEIRILEGPNLYFPHAAVKLTLDVSTVVDAPDEGALRLAAQMGLRNVQPGPPGTGFRQRFAARAVARLVRQIATEAGTHRLQVRVRPPHDPRRLIVAYPWRHRSRAEALAHAVTTVLDALPAADLDARVQQAARTVRDADLGPGPAAMHPRIPVVAVTGSAGTGGVGELLARMGRSAGRHVGLATAEGLFVDGERVEAGDQTGPGGAARLLARPEVDLAVTETAHHSILLGGIGVTHHDVSVVTDVSDPAGAASPAEPTDGHTDGHTADHVAEAKAVVARITRSDGWCVLNGDDPRVWAMRVLTPARPWVFSRDPRSPAVLQMLEDGGGRATTVIDGWVCVLERGHDADPLMRLDDAAADALGEVLAAVSAGLAVGLPRGAVVSALEGPGP